MGKIICGETVEAAVVNAADEIAWVRTAQEKGIWMQDNKLPGQTQSGLIWMQDNKLPGQTQSGL